MKRTLSFLLVLVMLLAVCSISLAEDKKTIRFLTVSQSIDMNTDYVGVLLEEMTGYHVEYEYWNSEDSLALEMTSNTEYDLITLKPAMYQTMLAQGALKNIAPLLEQYPDLKAAIAEVGWTYCTAEDGGIYGIPRITDPVHVTAMGYRTDIFAQYGYTEPNTIDELYNLMVSIKNDTGLIPMTGSESIIPVIASAFGITSSPWMVDEATQSVYSYLRAPGMKEYLAWMSKAYAEGLIDVDWPVNTTATITEKMGTSKAVMSTARHSATRPWIVAMRESGIADADIRTFIELEDANGERHINCNNGVSRVEVIPVTASDEDALYTLAMIASRNTEDVYWAFNCGIEGTHYYFDEDGYPLPILPIFTENMNNGDKYQLGRNQYVHPIAWMARVHKTEEQWNTFYDANSKAAAYPFTGDPLTYASFPEYAEYNSALETKCTDFFMQIIAGTASLDDYDSFVAEWEASGGKELEEAATVWYREHPALVKAAMSSNSPYAEIFGYTFE